MQHRLLPALLALGLACAPVSPSALVPVPQGVPAAADTVLAAETAAAPVPPQVLPPGEEPGAAVLAPLEPTDAQPSAADTKAAAANTESPGERTAEAPSSRRAGVAEGHAPQEAGPAAGAEGGEEEVLAEELGEALGEEAEATPVPLTGEALPFSAETGSLRVRRSIVVRAEPHEQASPIGTLAQDMRVRWLRAVRAPGCEAWVEVEPRGWVCARYLEANFRAPRVRELPAVPEGALTPGVYARVVGKRTRAWATLADARRGRGGRRLRGSVTVKLVAEVRVGRRTYWRTSDREYIDARFLRVFTPSAFVGLDRQALAQRPLPVAWALAQRRRTRPVVVRAAPAADAPVVALLPPRAVVRPLGLSMDRAWVQVEGGAWVARADLRVARGTPPPLGLAPGGHWLDVDLDEQVLVAYEGETPVYATLVSSGSRGHETPEGVFRIWLKFAETDMTGRMGDDSYRVSTVPWTMFFQDDFALHTAYWHERFGEPASHGCVNLAPQDARALYHWSEPEVPVGWSMAYNASTHPGSLVRVRTSRWPSALLPMTVHHGSGESCAPGDASPALAALE